MHHVKRRDRHVILFQDDDVSDAVEHIQSQAGRHFDPVLVGLFVAMVPALIEIQKRWAD